MSELSSVRCITPRCIETIAKYGERYHLVYVREGAPDGATHQCTHCGAKSIAGVWESRCKHCKALVPAGELVGLFVPHACRTCQDQIRAEQRATGNVCGRCKKPSCDCYC